MPRVEVAVVLDFMCPWSLIGMRSLQIAKERFANRLEFAPTEFTPFEFDPPGTYPPEGVDWSDYCRGYGPQKAKFLLEEKLPMAFALGKAIGINFRMDRRIVDTLDVNTALELAQRHNVAEPFVLETLSRHFEQLENPNEPVALRERLEALGVPGDDVIVALADPARAARNQERTHSARSLLRGGGVPHFCVMCGSGKNMCEDVPGGPTSPEYFERLFAKCLAVCQADL
eukprot:TRINITY_DN18024_c0_g1_i1.p1 TRINITY_DN18024_c0_g1~~TRINITY_DN18024_c0_g1_i1.p1  ORF type:complete len:229 (+),score=43.40 TRINITY_DN18024_c0_g1_i1:80-766(+)